MQTASRHRVVRAMVSGIILFTGGVTSVVAGDQIRIGVLSMQGHERCLDEWDETSRYLESRIPGIDATIVPIKFDEIGHEVESGSVDFLLCNSAIYVELEVTQRIRRIATLLRQAGTAEVARFGGVLFVRADSSRAYDYTDLRRASCAAVAPNSFGGYLTVVRELKELGAGVERLFESVTFLDTHDRVVEAVLAGEAEAGIVRTGVLERLMENSAIDRSDVRVLRLASRREDEGFPYLRTSRLYPEWPIAALPHVDEHLATQVASQLMSMDEDDSAARAAGIAGWTVAASYQTVHEALRAVGAPPYDVRRGPTLLESLRQHFVLAIATIVSVMLLVGMLVAVQRNRRLATESKHFLQSVIDAIPNRIMVVDQEKRVLLMNEAVRRLCSDPIPANPSCDSLFETGHWVCSQQASNCPICGVFREGETARLYAQRGEKSFVTTISPIRNRFGRISHAVELSRDITEIEATAKALEKSEALFRAIAEHAQDALILMDESGRITFWNRAAQMMFGYAAEEAIGSDLHELIAPEEHRRVFRKRFPQFLSTGEGPAVGRTIELDGLRQDGTTFPVEISLGSLYLSGSRLAVGIIRDVTERRRSAEKLEQAIVQAQTLAKSARAANEAKSAFLANMSHEIRTPMNGVIGMTDLLLGTELTDEQREYADTIARSADSLLSVVNDILDFSKIESGRLELEIVEFDLRALIGEMNDVLSIRPQQKGIEYVCDIDQSVPETLRGDPGRLRQVLTNLVGNAVKFTERGEIGVTVRLRSEDQDTVLLEFAVSDTGIGIAQDRIEELFEPFTQADVSTTRRYGGTGLGLSICSHLVSLMQGEMEVASAPDQGSTFVFTARFARTAHDSRNTRPTDRVLRAKRVLVVDDNETNRRILTGQLTHWECNAVSVDSAEAAMNELNAAYHEKQPFDLAIVDMLMPGDDGVALGRTIRGTSEFEDLPLVMLTSAGAGTDSAELREIGFARCLGKPVKSWLLRRHLIELLSGVSAEQGPRRRPGFEERDASTRALSVLIAEDNETNRRVAAAILTKRGHRIETATTGEEALERLRNADFDVVLMDVQMPVMDGIEATRHIRSGDSGVRNRDIPIIALTAHSMKGDRERFLGEGMDGYLSKPIKPDAVHQAFRDIGLLETEAEGESEQFDRFPVLDQTALLDLLNGDHQLATDIIGSFINDSRGILEEISEVAEQNDLDSIVRLAHSLKGAAANVGAFRLSRIAKRLEEATRAHDPPLIEGLLERLRPAHLDVERVFESQPSAHITGDTV